MQKLKIMGSEILKKTLMQRMSHWKAFKQLAEVILPNETQTETENIITDRKQASKSSTKDPFDKTLML